MFTSLMLTAYCFADYKFFLINNLSEIRLFVNFPIFFGNVSILVSGGELGYAIELVFRKIS